MEQEVFFSGYCRAIDQSRMVAAEQWEGSWNTDCAYPDCPYASGCQIAKKIEEGQRFPDNLREL